MIVANNWWFRASSVGIWLLLATNTAMVRADDMTGPLMGDVPINKGMTDWIYEEFSKQGTSGVVGDGFFSAAMNGFTWKDSTKLLVDVIAMDKGAEILLGPAFESTAFEKTGRCSEYKCSGFIPMANYPDLKARQEVRSIRPSICLTEQAGSKVSEALDSLQVDLVRQNLDPALNGTGLRIGMLSDSFDTSTTATTDYADDIASGDLPEDVTILEDRIDRSDEGRAMAQLVHDLIPGAKLFFHTASGGSTVFVDGIKALAAAGCDVIVDDITYPAEPFFQDGDIAQAANEVARNQGIPYFSSARNSDTQSWQGAFLDSGSTDGNGCPLHNFGGDADDVFQSVTLTSTRADGTILIVLNWDDPWFSVSGAPGSSRDLNLFLVGANDNVFADTENEIGGDALSAVVAPFGGTFGIAISFCNGPSPPTLMKWLVFGGRASNIEYDTQSSTSFGHPNAEFTAGVGAAFFQNTPEFGVDPPILEDFSSRGGTPILFEIDGTKKASAELRMQPRFVATDGNLNTFFGNSEFFLPNGFGRYFFGTSAAAPNAAAVAVLMLQANPKLSPVEIYEILQDTAIDMKSPGFDFDSGFGYIDALAAVERVLETTTSNTNPDTTTTSTTSTTTSATPMTTTTTTTTTTPSVTTSTPRSTTSTTSMKIEAITCTGLNPGSDCSLTTDDGAIAGCCGDTSEQCIPKIDGRSCCVANSECKDLTNDAKCKKGICGADYHCIKRPAKRGTVCRESKGYCPPEFCDGNNKSCPPQNKYQSCGRIDNFFEGKGNLRAKVREKLRGDGRRKRHNVFRSSRRSRSMGSRSKGSRSKGSKSRRTLLYKYSGDAAESTDDLEGFITHGMLNKHGFLRHQRHSENST